MLAAAAAALPLLAAGCKGVGALGAPPTPAPDVATLRRAVAAERLMVARYQAVLGSHAGLTSALSPVLRQHEAHLARLRSRLIEPRAGGSPSPSASARSPRPPGTPAADVSYLETAERDAASFLVRELAQASPSLAQLLASIAASEATHVPLLAAQKAAR